MSFGALVGIVSFFTALVAGDLIQRSEASPTSSSAAAFAVVGVTSVHSHSAVAQVEELHARLLLFARIVGHLKAKHRLVANLATVMAHDVFSLLHGFRNGQIEQRVHEFALRSIGAKATKILNAHHAPSVSMAA